MIDCYLKLVTADGETRYDNVVSFTYEKERYRCYAVFSGVFIGSCVPEDVIEVWFYLDGKLLHRGSADSLVCECRGREKLIKIRSFGFSMSLGQNELEPGIVSNATLVKLAQRSLTNTGYCSFQSNTPEVNYVYINEHTTLWEAICVYTSKAYNNYPFIKAQNTVWCDTSGGKSVEFTNCSIAETSRGVTLPKLISEAFTADSDGNWSVTLKDDFAIARRVSRQRYYARDNEWAYDPAAGLRYHMGIAASGRQYKQFTYVGYRGEDICDRAVLMNTTLYVDGEEIDRIKISGSGDGVFTTVRCYKDIYCG